MLINVLTFISRIKTTDEFSKERKICIFQHFCFLRSCVENVFITPGPGYSTFCALNGGLRVAAFSRLVVQAHCFDSSPVAMSSCMILLFLPHICL